MDGPFAVALHGGAGVAPERDHAGMKRAAAGSNMPIFVQIG